jgi:HD-like signal output (HDOD) protein
MIPAIRTSFTSTLELVTTWWRGRGVRLATAPSRHTPIVAPVAAATQDEPIHALLAEDALRRFLAFALDEKGAPTTVDEVREEHLPLIAEASAALSRLEVQAKYLPRRPSLLPRLLSAMNNDANSMRELAAIIGDDPALMGNLVRLANSAFYRGVRKSIESLERAVTLVGTEGVRGLIATALLHPVMTTRSGLFASLPETIWEQTLYAADAAEMHAVHVERVNGFGARLLALLHGLATNTVYRIVRDECLVRCELDFKPAMVKLLDEWAAPTSRRIAAAWEMPHELQAALGDAQGQGPLQRALFFGRLAGAQILLVKRGRLKESAARATVLAGDQSRMQVDRVWNRLVRAHLTPR